MCILFCHLLSLPHLPLLLVPNLESGGALEIAKERKLKSHQDDCYANGISFIPLAAETLGGWDLDAVFHLQDIVCLSFFISGKKNLERVRLGGGLFVEEEIVWLDEKKLKECLDSDGVLHFKDSNIKS